MIIFSRIIHFKYDTFESFHTSSLYLAPTLRLHQLYLEAQHIEKWNTDSRQKYAYSKRSRWLVIEVKKCCVMQKRKTVKYKKPNMFLVQ